MPGGTSFLIVDGHDKQESGEGLLVEHIARQSFDHVVRLPFFPRSQRNWTVVWFTGHTTIYKSAQIASLEKRESSAYWRLITAHDLTKLKTQLLVLATCFSASSFYPNKYAAEQVISYPDKLLIDDSLVFAARFMPPLTRNVRRGRLRFIRRIFNTARASSNAKWQMNSGKGRR